MLHYADKRDLRTLEYQMAQMNQGTKTMEAFNSGINAHFALIIRFLKNGNQNPEILGALVETYRDRALDVFIRGLSGDLFKLLLIRGPKSLPEAYAICLEISEQSKWSPTSPATPIAQTRVTIIRAFSAAPAPHLTLTLSGNPKDCIN